MKIIELALWMYSKLERHPAKPSAAKREDWGAGYLCYLSAPSPSFPALSLSLPFLNFIFLS